MHLPDYSSSALVFRLVSNGVIYLLSFGYVWQSAPRSELYLFTSLRTFYHRLFNHEHMRQLTTAQLQNKTKGARCVLGKHGPLILLLLTHFRTDLITILQAQ